MIRRLYLATIIALLASCSQGVDNNKLRVDVIEERPRQLSISALPLPEASAYLRNATAQGLVEFDGKGRIVPALASRWIVTDDGLSYIFRLNKTTWNDGREVTSEEIARLLNARLLELRGLRLGDEIAVIDRAVSMTGKVVEIRLKAPMPYLLEMLAQPEFGLTRRGFGSGPMQARKVERGMQLRRREQDERGKWVLGSETIALRSENPSVALARYLEGQNDFVTGGRFESYPLLEAAKINNDEIHFDAGPGLFGLLVKDAGSFLSDPANREAIAMAIDRPRLLASFDNVSWQEALTLVPETLPSRADAARPAWAQEQMDNRKAQARETVSRWITAHGTVRPLRIAMPRGPGSRVIFAMLRRDFGAIGLDAERVTPDQDADLLFVDQVADQSTPAWYLTQLSCEATPVCSTNADALVAQARMASDSAMRTQLLAQAEAELQATRNFIPIANPLRWSVARTRLKGFYSNGRGWHLLQYLGREPT